MEIVDSNIKLIVIDCFCGAGGVTEGFHRAMLGGSPSAVVVIGINHDSVAIASHKANHPETHHFVEDFTTLDPNELVGILADAKIKYPNAKVLFWMSAECTHHSRAKGGQPRNADSRSLAEYAYTYIEILKPDIIGVENVVEFLSWGPLDANARPIPELKGVYYDRWVNTVKGYGYSYEHQVLNAADYGAFTSRTRYFGIFSLNDAYISFPKQTHSKAPSRELRKWRAVKDILQLSIEGKSIFTRKKPLVDATLRRILAGLIKFVAGGSDNWRRAYNSFLHPFVTLEYLVPTTSENTWLLKYNSVNGQNGKHIPPSIQDPSPTVSCQGRLGIVSTDFLYAYYGSGKNIHSVDSPAPTIPTKDRCALVEPKFIQNYYSPGTTSSVMEPAATVRTKDSAALVEPVFNPWIMDTQFSNVGQSLAEPMRTITANRKHFYLMQAENGGQIAPGADDSPVMSKIKTFMLIYGIADIKMRMLTITELKRIMGFGDDYKLLGKKADQKKFIGNAVECTQSRVIAESLSEAIENYELIYT